VTFSRPPPARRSLVRPVYVAGKPVERSTGLRDEGEAAALAQTWQQEAEAQSHPAAASAGVVTLNDVLSELLDDTRAKIRDGRRSEETYDFYEKKAGSLLAFFGHAFDVAAWAKDSKASWDYIRWRRSSKVADASIKKSSARSAPRSTSPRSRARFRGSPPSPSPPRSRRRQERPTGRQRGSTCGAARPKTATALSPS
jgi:hypothetical protein